MYQLSDTIAAVSSPGSGQRVIIRVTGPETISLCRQIFTPTIEKDKAGLVAGSVIIDDELKIDAVLYLFLAPHSYTAETLAEFHLDANKSITEQLLSSLFAKGLRMAGPGEFTARSYLNGKIDLAQAEAVGEIISSSNKFQLDAAEKLLAGRLTEKTANIQSAIIDCLSLIEAGLDFSQQDIEFISTVQATERLLEIKSKLRQLLADSISYESVIDLPAVGIAGSPNAGKSSLLNKLLGKERSIVSNQRKTTRDVLGGLVTLDKCKCVLFDCAGLIKKPENILDELAQTAAVETLRNSLVVMFCVDVSKSEWAEDVEIRKLIDAKFLIPIATKTDLITKEELPGKSQKLKDIFGADFLPVSTETGGGMESLCRELDDKIIELTNAPTAKPRVQTSCTPYKTTSVWQNAVALTARHKQVVTEAIDNITEAVDELKTGNDEVTAMLLRAAYQSLANIEHEHVDEKILENIFSNFCIGK